FSEPSVFPNQTDPDLMIYSGFLGPIDKKLLADVRLSTEIDLAEKEFHFVDARLPEMLFRYKARNFPGSLNEEEQDRWETYRTTKLLDGNSQYITFKSYFERIQEIANGENASTRDLNILEDLKYYAESILPYN
ncbi:MAG: exodeoxyribonuclease-1, partial [Oleiphilaceae bacterium]